MLLHLHTAMDLEEEKHKTCWFLLGQKKRGGGEQTKKGLTNFATNGGYNKLFL